MFAFRRCGLSTINYGVAPISRAGPRRPLPKHFLQSDAPRARGFGNPCPFTISRITNRVAARRHRSFLLIERLGELCRNIKFRIDIQDVLTMQDQVIFVAGNDVLHHRLEFGTHLAEDILLPFVDRFL